MKKLKFAGLCVLLFLGLCAIPASEFSLSLPGGSGPQKKEIVCWGDSMTAGYGASEAILSLDGNRYDISDLSYPEVLQRLTGIKTCNFGVFGATSEEISIMQGGTVPEQPLSAYDVIDRDVMRQAESHPGDILILEMGSNGGWKDYDELIAQYRAMLAHAACEKYIIIGDTDDPLNSADPHGARGSGTTETAWENALREAFGDHFINMRVFLVENGLELVGWKATPADEAAARQGNISARLRADWTHFNSYGYYAQAVGVYQKGRQLGYWQ